MVFSTTYLTFKIYWRKWNFRSWRRGDLNFQVSSLSEDINDCLLWAVHAPGFWVSGWWIMHIKIKHLSNFFLRVLSCNSFGMCYKSNSVFHNLAADALVLLVGNCPHILSVCQSFFFQLTESFTFLYIHT